jgi:hypothetical protein
MQRSLYNWFDEALNDNIKSPIQTERLACFKPVVDQLKSSGRVDSGTKITLLRLLRDLDSFDYSKLRRLVDHPATQNQPRGDTTTTGDETSGSNYNAAAAAKWSKSLFFVKLVILKFDLKFCSAKEFVELLGKLDNGAIKYIELTHKCRITLRDLDRLSVRNFMGEIEATIESRSDKALVRAELSLKRLADSIHYRLAKQIPSSDSVCVGGGSFNNLKILLQSPVSSSVTASHDTSSASSRFSSSALNTTATTTTSNTTASNFETNTTTTATDDTANTTTDNNDTSTKSSDAVKNGKKHQRRATLNNAKKSAPKPQKEEKKEQLKKKETNKSEEKAKKTGKNTVDDSSDKKQRDATATASKSGKSKSKKTGAGSTGSASDTLNESSGNEHVCTCDKGKNNKQQQHQLKPSSTKNESKEQQQKKDKKIRGKKETTAALERSINADDSSILEFSSRNDSMGGSTTPLTSSPVSSSGSLSAFRFKETVNPKKSGELNGETKKSKNHKSSSKSKKTVHTVVA